MDDTDGPGERETRGVTSILPVWQWRCTQHVTDVTLHRSYPRLGLALSECKQWSGPCLFISRFKKVLLLKMLTSEVAHNLPVWRFTWAWHHGPWIWIRATQVKGDCLAAQFTMHKRKGLVILFIGCCAFNRFIAHKRRRSLASDTAKLAVCVLLDSKEARHSI